MNDRQAAHDGEEGFSSFHSIGALAAGWAARAQAHRRAAPAAEDEPCFLPIAWAAE